MLAGKPNSAGRVVLFLFSVGLASSTAAGGPRQVAEPGGEIGAGGTGSLQIVFDAGPYRFVDGHDGTRLEMEGFDHLKEPGRPMLPEKEFLVLLPPGARLLSLDVEPLGTRRLPGRYRLAATPPLLPLAGGPAGSEPARKVMADWERLRALAYSDDHAYPEQAARLVGAGTLRKYSYVRVAFCPFTYRPASGLLHQHDAARVRIAYTLPAEDSARAGEARRLLADTVADARASELFVNYESMKGRYQPEVRAGAEATLLDHYDLVIITTPSLADAIASSEYVGWKTNLGFDVRVVLTSDPEIAGQPGADLPEQVRNFLRAYYASWGIEYVLIVGNQDIPMRDCYPDPDNHTHHPQNPSTNEGSVPTDAYYADLSLPDAESWDLDGDGYHGEYGEDAPDLLTEVYVGRIPTDNANRVIYTLRKLARFEGISGAWKRNVLHAGAVFFYPNQNMMGIPFRDGATALANIERDFMPDWSISRYSEQDGLIPSGYAWPALTEAAFSADWRAGEYGIVNWGGHGAPDSVWRTIWSWDDGDGVPETDGSDTFDHEAFIADWVNVEDDRPSIVFAVSCNVGYPDPNTAGNLGIDLLTDESLGAAAGVMSASRYAHVTFDWPAIPGGAEEFVYEFNRHMIAMPGGARKLGVAAQDSKTFCHLNYAWDSPAEYRNQFDYNLYGDPSMEWVGAGPRLGNLLRSAEVQQCDPVTPPLGDVLPLDPAEDLHLPDFTSGSSDPDPADGAALVFYKVDGPVWIWMDKGPGGAVRIEF